MSHDHSSQGNVSNARLVISIALTLAFVAGEAIAGYLAHSLALMSDAVHNLTDALALFLSWYAIRAAKRPASPQRTFGSHRVGILTSLANALTLVAIGAVILWEAAQRLTDPTPVQSAPMIWVALIGVVLNGLISLWLQSGAKNDLNIRSAYLHMLGDAISALGVAVAGIFMAVTGNPIADPLISLAIGGFIIWSSWDVLTESLNILLEATPKHLDVLELIDAIKSMNGVVAVHDLHAWTITSGMVAVSCHVVVSEQTVKSGQQVLKAVVTILRQDFAIAHTTIQIEVDGCDQDDMYCTLQPAETAHEEHRNQ